MNITWHLILLLDNFEMIYLESNINISCLNYEKKYIRVFKWTQVDVQFLSMKCVTRKNKLHKTAIIRTKMSVTTSLYHAGSILFTPTWLYQQNINILSQLCTSLIYNSYYIIIWINDITKPKIKRRNSKYIPIKQNINCVCTEITEKNSLW